jgi:hypothetical protein
MSADGFLAVAMGHRGSGKTNLIRRLAGYDTFEGPALYHPRRLLVCDPEKKWQLQPGDVLVSGAAELLGVSRGLLDPRRAFRVVYQDDAAPMQLAGPGAAFAIRNLTVVVDEMAWLCHSGYLPPYLKRLVQYGRERRINLLGTTREPQEIHNLIVTQADVRFFFWTEQGNGLDRIRRWYRVLGEGLDTLPPLQYRTHGNAAVLGRLGREGLDIGPRRGQSSRRVRRQA